MHLQIDTYEDVDVPDAEPVHRAFCQIKIFRDKVNPLAGVTCPNFVVLLSFYMFLLTLKGAERKNKDESRSAEKRMQKLMKQSSSLVGMFEFSFFYSND